MPFEPDLRADRSESSEGRGIAKARREKWIRSLPEDFQEAMDLSLNAPWDQEPALAPHLSKDVLAQWAQSVREQSELIGFWIAWHQAGGFQGLLLSGWNRATIYRKLKRFRTMFDAHPDEHDFSWIRLDLSRAWFEALDVTITDPELSTKKSRK